MISFKATAFGATDDDGLVTVQFDDKRRKYLQFQRDLGGSPINPAPYVEVNDQGSGAYGCASKVELHPDKVVVTFTSTTP